MSCIYYAHWWQRVMDGAAVTKWAVNFKQRSCNTLAVKHKYSDSLPINEQTTIKVKATKVKGTHKYSTKLLSTHFFSRIFLPYWLKHRRRFGWCHTSVLFFLSVHFAGFLPTKTTPFTVSSICYDKELNCWFFASSVWRRLWESLIIQAIFPNDKRVPRSTRWK